jgi:cytochrome c biogenesis protein CcdA
VVVTVARHMPMVVAVVSGVMLIHTPCILEVMEVMEVTEGARQGVMEVAEGQLQTEVT